MSSPDDSVAEPSEADFVALAVGQKVGRYEIVAVLGQGGFGITYRAHDTQLNRDVAIKEYLPTALAVRHDGTTVLPRSTKVAEDFAWGRQRFVDEGRTLATLQRAPAIVRVFDFLEANGTAYIVMELVPGDTLEGRLRSAGAPLGAADIERIVWPLLEGMERVHATGFLHRDIKPANILLSADGRPTLIDFGASRVAVAGRSAAMTAIFTPGYAAAEQFTSARQGPWTDIYGLSATFYHAITGGPPPSAFDRMLADDFRPLSEIAPEGFAPALLAGIDHGLSVRASARPQTISDWRAILQGKVPVPEPVAQPEPVPGTAPTATNEPTPPPAARSSRGLWLGAAVAALLVMAGGGYLFLGKGSGEKIATVVTEAEKKAEAERQKVAQEIERLRGEKEARDKAEADAKREAALRQQVEEETRAKLSAEQAAQQAEKQRLEEEARKKAEAEVAMKANAVGLPPAPPLAPVSPYNGVYSGAAVFGANRYPTSTHVTGGKGTGTWPVGRCGPTVTLSYVLTIDMAGAARLDMQGFDQGCTPSPYTTTGHVEGDKLVLAWGDKGNRLELTRTSVDPDPALVQAEAGETALRLSALDRQHVQVALTSLGLNTNGTNGVFGPHTRDMIKGWQTSHRHQATGFLTGPQNQYLLKEASAAITKFDEAATSSAAGAGFDGVYSGKVYIPTNNYETPTTVHVAGGKGTGSFPTNRCGVTSIPYTLTIDPAGSARIDMQSFDQSCTFKTFTGTGKVERNALDIPWGSLGSRIALSRSAAPAAAPQAATSKPQPSATFDGNYVGQAFGDNGATNGVTMRIVNGSGSGSWNIKRCGPDVVANFTLQIDASGAVRIDWQGFDGTCGPQHVVSTTGRIDGGHIVSPYGRGTLDLMRSGN
jgi:serine/threonine protein kinase